MRARKLRCCAVVAAALGWLGIELFSQDRLRAADEAPRLIKAHEVARGRELFVRVWGPQDARCRSEKANSSLSGDGLGPVFNDTSCAACHSQGGVGGAGSLDKNVQILVLRQKHGSAPGEQLHPGLSHEGSATVLHRSSVLPSYVKWRQSRLNLADTVFEAHLVFDMLAAGLPTDSSDRKLLASLAEKLSRESEIRIERPIQFEGLRFSQPPLFLTERNPPALFGASLIDAIRDDAILAAAQAQRRIAPQIAGRAVRTSDGRIGRFGWQAQQATLVEFTLTACAVELGLTVPGHAQASNPQRPDHRAPGLDVSQDDCDALIAFVASLAPPREQVAGVDVETVRTGKQLFSRIGCADCHLPDLDGVKGIYSDLLLHNMGHQLAGETAGGYGAFVSVPQRDDSPAGRFVCRECGFGAARVDHSAALECRTPPLWGVASSGPYLHDGRAATLRAAILMHAGQGAAAAAAFQALDEQQRQFLLIFLNSLVAPRASDVISADELPGASPTAAAPPHKKSLPASFKPRRQRIAGNNKT